MVHDDNAKGLSMIAENGAQLVCLWHGRLLCQAMFWRGPGIDMLISRSRDGQMIADTARRFGHGYIAGSTASGGRDRRSAAAAREVVLQLEAGRIVGITPDGPRGPRMRVSMGIIRLAQMAGVGVVPVAASTSAAFRAKSWDRMIVPIPRPGAKGVLMIGDTIFVPADAANDTLADIRLTLENRMNDMCETADRMVGAPTISPAPSPS